jgi:rhodanese-related sulfurtransferase
MAIQMKKPDPAKALEYFQNKMKFTTGPVEVDYYMNRGDDLNLIDVRAADDYASEHAARAQSLPEDEWDTFKGLSKDKLNVLYCYSHVCHLAAKAAVKFAAAGYPVMEMDGGFEAWKDHELPTSQGSASTATVDQVAS